MRVLGSSVLIFEMIVIGLATLVAVFGAGVDRSLALPVGFGLMLLCIIAAGMITKPAGIALGWVVQVGVLASGFVVPGMPLLGIVFAGLWFMAVRLGTKADQAKRAQGQ